MAPCDYYPSHKQIAGPYLFPCSTRVAGLESLLRAWSSCSLRLGANDTVALGIIDFEITGTFYLPLRLGRWLFSRGWVICLHMCGDAKKETRYRNHSPSTLYMYVYDIETDPQYHARIVTKHILRLSMKVPKKYSSVSFGTSMGSPREDYTISKTLQITSHYWIEI